MENNKPEKADESSPLAWFNKGFSLTMICVVMPSMAAASVWQFFQGGLIRAVFPGLAVVILLATLYRQRKEFFPPEMARWRCIFLPASGIALGVALIFIGGAFGMGTERKRLFDAPTATITDARQMLVDKFLANDPKSAAVLCHVDDVTSALRPIHVLHGNWHDILKLRETETGLFHATLNPAQKKRPEAAIVWGPAQEGKPGSAGVWYIYDGFIDYEVNGRAVQVRLVTLLAAQSELQNQK